MQAHKRPRHPPVKHPFQDFGFRALISQSSMQRQNWQVLLTSVEEVLRPLSLSVPTSNPLKVSTSIANNCLTSAMSATSKCSAPQRRLNLLRIAISAKGEIASYSWGCYCDRDGHQLQRWLASTTNQGRNVWNRNPKSSDSLQHALRILATLVLS